MNAFEGANEEKRKRLAKEAHDFNELVFKWLYPYNLPEFGDGGYEFKEPGRFERRFNQSRQLTAFLELMFHTNEMEPDDECDPRTRKLAEPWIVVDSRTIEIPMQDIEWMTGKLRKALER